MLATLALALLALSPVMLPGQQRPPDRFSTAPAAHALSDRLVGPELPPVEPAELRGGALLPIAAGVAGGAAGFVVGGLAGALVGGQTDCYDMDCIFYPLVGASLGQSVGIPLGVHAGSGGRSQLDRSMAVSASIGAGGLFLLALIPADAVLLGLFTAVPLVQLGTSVAAIP